MKFKMKVFRRKTLLIILRILKTIKDIKHKYRKSKNRPQNTHNLEYIKNYTFFYRSTTMEFKRTLRTYHF